MEHGQCGVNAALLDREGLEGAGSGDAELLFVKIDLHMGDHPMAWTRRIGKGKSFDTAIGHRPESNSEPHVVQRIEQGIEWTATH